MFVSTLFVQAALAAAAIALPSSAVKRDTKVTSTAVVPIPSGIPAPDNTDAVGSAQARPIKNPVAAGSAIFGPRGEINNVNGQFRLPLARRPDPDTLNSRAIEFIGLDIDDGCGTFFAGGVEANVVGEIVTYAAFYQWGNQLDTFNDVQLNADDVVAFTLTTDSPERGAITVTKNGGEQSQTVALEHPDDPLCFGSAGWLVGGDPQEPLADFGEIVYEHAQVFEREGSTVGPSSSGAFLYKLVRDGKVLAEASTNDEDEFSLTVTYSGST